MVSNKDTQMILCLDLSLDGLVMMLFSVEAGEIKQYWSNFEDLAAEKLEQNRIHSAVLADQAIALCQLAGHDSLSGLNKIYVGYGPGSFTGIKVALAFAAGFSRARGDACQVLPFSMLGLLAEQFSLEIDEGWESCAFILPATRFRAALAKRHFGEDYISIADFNLKTITAAEFKEKYSLEYLAMLKDDLRLWPDFHDIKLVDQNVKNEWISKCLQRWVINEMNHQNTNEYLHEPFFLRASSAEENILGTTPDMMRWSCLN